MEYYSAIKRNEIGSFVEMWMDLDRFFMATDATVDLFKLVQKVQVSGSETRGLN